ncbi:type II toxin-antitoxin system RelE family toxin [Streptomyces sp. NPDC054919]
MCVAGAMRTNGTAFRSQGPDAPLRPFRRGRRRLRVGDYRVDYTIDNGELVVWVVHVGHRSTVYDT